MIPEISESIVPGDANRNAIFHSIVDDRLPQKEPVYSIRGHFSFQDKLPWVEFRETALL